MDMEKDKILDKIKKLLKLGKNTNFDGEAHQALAAAMRLAAGIGMTIEEVSVDDEEKKEASAIGITEPDFKARTQIPAWESQLANGIGRAIGCVVLISTWSKGSYRRQTFRVVGTKADGILFCWLYPYVVKQLRVLCHRDWDEIGFRTAWNRKAWEKSWYAGAAIRVVEMAMDFFKENATEDESQQYALVVANKFNMAQAWANNAMNIKDARHRASNEDVEAKRLGYRSGQEVTMARPLAESRAQEAVEA